MQYSYVHVDGIYFRVVLFKRVFGSSIQNLPCYQSSLLPEKYTYQKKKAIIKAGLVTMLLKYLKEQPCH